MRVPIPQGQPISINGISKNYPEEKHYCIQGSDHLGPPARRDLPELRGRQNLRTPSWQQHHRHLRLWQRWRRRAGWHCGGSRCHVLDGLRELLPHAELFRLRRPHEYPSPRRCGGHYAAFHAVIQL